MSVTKSDWDKVCEFHGDACPGLAIGYQVTQLAMQEIGAHRSDCKEMVAIVENNACGMDALQVLTGCTFGGGNLFIRDYGKYIYILASKEEGHGVRFALKYGVLNHPEFYRLRQQASAGQIESADKQRLVKLQGEYIDQILNAARDSFDITFVNMSDMNLSFPARSQLNKSVQCSSCSERVTETYARYINGKVLCIPCELSFKQKHGHNPDDHPELPTQ